MTRGGVNKGPGPRRRGIRVRTGVEGGGILTGYLSQGVSMFAQLEVKTNIRTLADSVWMSPRREFLELKRNQD